ncbi:hypothetical protein HNQ51_000766 [Inhella inkyongensis]|uniref:Uncharacterized protein n=1 Tax=Inhella inkyongensis TaxID=392593 RepID=A0A840S130_9BURK|nr:hypothetical protein [Inhella inkyongensis]MBB5203473.1 hypothetical protein [Inhella inkyongensis]
MIRCALALAATVLASPLLAQTHRHFPADALRGEIKFLQPPAVQLNGKPQTLSPGSRLQGENGMGVLSGELIGRAHSVHYTLNTDGQLRDVWILNATERQNRVWPKSREEANRWTFDPSTQTWSKP